jgi:hypothetical protein
MRTKIIGFGDSFVFGSELKNNHDGSQGWIGLAARQLGVEYETLAVPGCGNENITRQILTYFSNNPANNALAVINWTWGARWDFYVSNKEQWTTLGLSCVPPKLAPLVGLEEAEKVLEFYNTYTGRSILWDRFRTLQTIYFSQQFLKSINVPSVQTFMDYEMWDTTWHAPDYIRTLQDLTKDPLQNFEGLNFVDWSKKHGFFVTDPGLHPLEDAHRAACELWVNTYAKALKS